MRQTDKQADRLIETDSIPIDRQTDRQVDIKRFFMRNLPHFDSRTTINNVRVI